MTTWKGLADFMLIRIKNPMYIGALVLALGTSVLAYFGFNPQDLTSWQMVLDLIFNAFSTPYVWILTITQFITTTVSFDTPGVLDNK